MPLPKQDKEAQPASKTCQLCQIEIDEEDQTREGYIEASCNKCQTGHYHVSCATELLEKRFKQATSKQAKNAAFYLRQPHAEMARGRCPATGNGEAGCPGFITDAEWVRRAKPAPAPPPATAANPAQPKPPRSTSGSTAQLAASQCTGKLAKTGKIRTSGSQPERRPPQPLPAAQPAVLRDRLGRRLAPPAAAEVAVKKRPALKFPGGMRPEELTLCRHWEARGECDMPNCVFAHSEEELIEREDAYRAEQARLKREAKLEAEARKLAEKENAKREAMVAEFQAMPPSASFGASEEEASESGVDYATSTSGFGGREAGGGGGGFGAASRSGSSVWDDLVARARAGMQAALGGGSTAPPSTARSGASTPATGAEDEGAAEGEPPHWVPVYDEPPPAAHASTAVSTPLPLPVQPTAAAASAVPGPPPPLTPLPVGAFSHANAYYSAQATQPPPLAPVPAPNAYDAGYAAGLAATAAVQPQWQAAAAAPAAPTFDVDWGVLLGGEEKGQAVSAAAAGPAAQPGGQAAGEEEFDDLLALLCST